MHAAGPNNPLHGITLVRMLTDLQAYYGWKGLGQMIPVNCFTYMPSMKSSLIFLRKTPWARAKVEALYLDSLGDMQPKPEIVAEALNEQHTKAIAEPSADTTPSQE